MISKSINLTLFGRFPTERAYGVHVVAVAKSYSKLGYKATIFYPSTDNEKTIFEDPQEYYNTHEVQFQKINHPDITKFYFYKILPKMMKGLLWSITAYQWSKKIKEYIKDSREIIWSTNPILLYGSLQENNYIIFEMHGRAKKIQAIALKLLDRKASNRSLFISSSHYGRKDLLNRKFKTKIEYLPNGVDLNLFKPTPETKEEGVTPSNCLHIGYVGQLETYGVDKGMYLTIDALEKSINLNPHQQCGPILLTVIGGPEESAERLKGYLDKKESQSLMTINYLGQKKQSELASFITKFDIGIVPYPEDKHISFYSSPMKIFEYAACGIPVVVSDIYTHRSLDNVGLGLEFYKADDVDSLANLLSKYLHNQNREGKEGLASLGEMNISVRNGLSWEVRSKKTLDKLFS